MLSVDAEPNFIFIIILARACYGFWRLFLLRLYFFVVVHVACSSSATPLRSSTGSRTDSRSVHAASPLLRRSYRELRRARRICSTPHSTPPPVLSFLPHAGELSCIFTCGHGTSGKWADFASFFFIGASLSCESAVIANRKWKDLHHA